MRYNKKYAIAEDYQGESFSRSLNKDSLAVWEATEVADYELIDGDGVIVSSGALAKSGDNLSLILTVPKADTEALSGSYLLLVYLKDSGDPTFNDVIAEYKMTYKIKKA